MFLMVLPNIRLGRWRMVLLLTVLTSAIAIYGNLPGRKQLVVFPNAVGHGSLTVDRPDLWKQQVSGFLNQANKDRVTN